MVNVSKNLNSKTQKVIGDALATNKGIKDIIKGLSEVFNGSEYELERIAKTESHNVFASAREASYSKSIDIEKAEFKWVGPNQPGRTTEYCKRIKARTLKGVGLDELKEIIREEADPKTYDVGRPYQPHIGCRHIQVRVR